MQKKIKHIDNYSFSYYSILFTNTEFYHFYENTPEAINKDIGENPKVIYLFKYLLTPCPRNNIKYCSQQT